MTSLVRSAPRTLGSLGEVGPIAYGQWRYTTDDLDHAQGLLETALDAGMNLIDTADVYGLDWGGTGFGAVEALLGKVIARAPALRSRMVLATKGGITPPTPYDSSPEWLRTAVDDSLRRLAVDVIDLYQIHRPDLYAHPAEVAATLAALREAGKIREVGVSNHTTEQVRALQAHLPFPLVSNQPEFSAVALDPMRDGTFDHCMASGIVPLAWSPLAGGRLATGEGLAPELVAVLDGLATREAVDRGSIALAFVLAHPAAPVAIIGTQNPARITASLDALDVQLDRADVYAIVQASEGQPLP
ncbi:MAG: aldo/keto reductase [Ilumatobacter sp.]|uniref:aldo/keto reductase n=1 Tax=Ilumatobacter sp. TaxID=1967498 RepID=UPI002614E309|nr:aldo/keto reductase [Ilumatobacter sp.]MDJ0771241.1 aldo/keto reductase [Ilumatobacter sp.]